MYNAFYHEDKYYLLSQEFSDYDGFRSAVRGEIRQFLVVPLREDQGICSGPLVKGHSIAPYFLSGYGDDPVELLITDPNKVYPVEVSVYTQEEYNARLRDLVLNKCPGCLRYKDLSNRSQSLNGHFEEMSLDGVCLFRQETKLSPRIFHDHLFSFGGFYMRFNYYDKSAREMSEELKSHFYTTYQSAELYDHGTQKELVLTLKKNELMLPVLTSAISHYLDYITHHRYHIRTDAQVPDTTDLIEQILSSENTEQFRKDCKKYGVSLAVLEYSDQGTEEIRASLKPLVDHFWLFPLACEEGKTYYLLADTSYILKELRYRSPMLQAYHTRIKVFGQAHNRAYDISFQMPYCEF